MLFWRVLNVRTYLRPENDFENSLMKARNSGRCVDK